MARWRQEQMTLNAYVLAQTYALRSATGLGFLALTWSAVVLLGGSVTSIKRTDFWCITVISMVQAARIFNDLAENRFVNFALQALYQIFLKNAALIEAMNYQASVLDVKSIILNLAHAIWVLLGLTIILPCTVIVWLPFLVAAVIYDTGPLACIGVSCWRIVKHDYINTESNPHLVPALDIFYSLVLCQGVFYCIWLLGSTETIQSWQVTSLCYRCNFKDKDWGSASITAYLCDTKVRCWKDPGSIHGRTLIHYAIDLLGAESWQENLSGARMLDAFIMQGADVRSLLLPSRPKIQKLIDMLGWKRGPPGNREMKEVAARIVADLAGDIHLDQFPGAIRCISSVMIQDRITLIYWRNSDHPPCKEPNQNQNMLVEACRAFMNLFEKRLTKQHQQISRVPELKEPDGSAGNDSGCSAEVILQGLTILKRLASNQQNCSCICTAPGLLPKITAPLYSDTLIQDMCISGMWPDLLNGSFKVLHRLICAPGWTGRWLRHEISCNNQAMDNLENIMDQDNGASQELKIQATKILGELVLDSSIKLHEGTNEKFIKKQLQIFLSAAGEHEPASKPNQLKKVAGTMLVLMTSNCKTNSHIIMKAYDADNLAPPTGLTDDKNTGAHLSEVTIDDEKSTASDSNEITEDKKNTSGHVPGETDDSNNLAHLSRLTELFGATNNIIYKTIAAEILKNLCVHCNLDGQLRKETLLQKVIAEISSTQNDQPERKMNRENQTNSAVEKNGENEKYSASRTDEEKQQNFAPGTNKQVQGNCAPEACRDKKGSSQQNGKQTTNKKLQEALLSLALVICDKLIIADVVRDEDLGGEAFVMKLKAIVDDNCQPTADSLRIVKLCGQIAASMMQFEQYPQHFRNKEFAQSLSKASKIMSNLESCMIFAGTDFGLKKTIRPLLSELEKEVSDLEKKVSI